MRYFENKILATRCSAKNDQNVDTQAKTANLLFWDKNEFVHLHDCVHYFNFSELNTWNMEKVNGQYDNGDVCASH